MEELNRWIHRFLERCTNPDENCNCTPLDYCSSLDLASQAEAKAIELVGENAYFEYLCYATQDATWRPEYEKREVTFCLSLATATALQRCIAIRTAVETAEG